MQHPCTPPAPSMTSTRRSKRHNSDTDSDVSVNFAKIRFHNVRKSSGPCRSLNTICAYHFSISSLPVVYVVTYKVYKGTTTPYVLFYCLFYFIALRFLKTFFGVSRNPQPSQIPLQIAQCTYLVLTSHPVKLCPISCH
jgi:hypothetical protein